MVKRTPPIEIVAPCERLLKVPTMGDWLSMIVKESLAEGVKPSVASSAAPPRETVPVASSWS